MLAYHVHQAQSSFSLAYQSPGTLSLLAWSGENNSPQKTQHRYGIH